LFAPPNESFPRAGEGTVQRCLTIDLYKDEINELYAKYGDKELCPWCKNVMLIT
jgi:hypothetical protein